MLSELLFAHKTDKATIRSSVKDVVDIVNVRFSKITAKLAKSSTVMSDMLWKVSSQGWKE